MHTHPLPPPTPPLPCLEYRLTQLDRGGSRSIGCRLSPTHLHFRPDVQAAASTQTSHPLHPPPSSPSAKPPPDPPVPPGAATGGVLSGRLDQWRAWKGSRVWDCGEREREREREKGREGRLLETRRNDVKGQKKDRKHNG